MDKSTLKDYEELCRLCASYDAIKLPIFSERGRARNLKDKITTCLPFDVSEDDLLPKSLCYRCIYNLENFYDFRRGCIDARTRLENVIKEVLKNEPKDENTVVKLEDTSTNNEEPRLENDIIESDGEADCPNPADFVEACWAESPHYGSRQGDDEEGTFPCKICDRTFSTKSSLTIHAKFHQDISGGPESNKENYSCFVCDKVFSSKGHLALHSKVHIGETASPPLSTSSRSSPANMKLYRCDLCNKTYSMAKHLWGHVSTTHKGHPLVTCGLCQRTFSSISNLEDHKRIKHKDDQLTDETTHSAQLIEDDSNLEKKYEELPSNRRKNSKPRKIERDMNNLEVNNTYINSDSNSGNIHSECHQSSPDKSISQKNFSTTLKTEKTYIKTENQSFSDCVHSCFMCEEQFRDADSLSQHLLQVHSYDGPLDFSNYNRNECGEEYAESMMEAETVFCCEICIREFNDRGSLWLHLLYSHKNAASKACGVCLKICEDTESLVQHVETAHPRSKSDQRRYSCQVCARQHDSRKKLVTHAKIHKLVDADGNLVDPETVVVQNADFYPDGFLPHPLDDNYLSCEICFKVFDNDSKLLKHKRSAHKDLGGMNNSLNPGAYHFYFACEICGLSHLSRADRWKHMSTMHAGDPNVTCEVPECGKVFPTSSIKREHASHHAAQGQYPNTCEVCGKMWKTRVEYWKHMMGVHPDCLPFICGVCLKVFCNLTTLVSHVRETHWPLLGGDFCCDICGRPYSKVSKMTRHRKVHYVPDNPPELQALLDNPKVQSQPHFLQQSSSLVCDMCENSTTEYENIEALGKHRHETHNVMPCDLCTKYYGRTSHLWKHVNKIHKGHPDVTCPTCQRTSASKSHLATHIAKHHRTEEMGPHPSKAKESNGVHTCEKCSKVFRKETLVRKHIKHCKGPRPNPIPLPPPVNGVYSCEKCDKSFSARNLLYKHMKHSHITFKCEICDAKTYSRTELYQHVCAEHADHPDVKCSVTGCDKILRCKADLERHQKNHRLSFQLHFCKFCAELVTSKYKLRRHLKAIHGNESKFLCALCLKALPGYKELRAHVEANHKAALDRGFTCQVCAKSCSNKSKLMEHIKYHGANFLPCKICLKIFSSKEELDNHIDNHPSDSGDEEDQVEDVELDTNSIMDIIGASKTDVNAEEEDKESDKRKVEEEEEEDEENKKPKKKSKLEVECSVCSEIFYSKMSLRRHMKAEHNIKPVINRYSVDKKDSTVADTSVTGSSMNEESDTSAWDNTGDSDKNFMHQLGLMPDAEKSKIKPIRKVYTDDMSPSKCEICGKVWPAKKHLWQHYIRFHKNECGRTCGVCLKLCPDFPCLSAHLAIEHPDNFNEDTELICRVCGKYHNAKSKLLNHVSIHVGHEERALDTVHHCLICNEVFEEFSQFCHHIRSDHNIGEGEVSGKEDCLPKSESPSYEESINDSLKNNENQGTKLPFHTCDVCSLVFASEIGLTNHKRIHENSDNFKCGQCGEVFQSAENLCTHKLQKHKGTEFVCADCKSNFSTYTQLTEHNKQCKMKLKNLGDDSDDDELLLDDDIEDLETSYDVNDTVMSSESDDLEKTGFPEENDLESQASLSDEDEKSNISEISHKEPKAVEAFLFDSNVEVVQVHLDDNSKL